MGKVVFKSFVIYFMFALSLLSWPVHVFAFAEGQARSEKTVDYRRDIEPILNGRCVVCHGCYDAPCQLKMEAFDGLQRGASKKRVYDGTRIFSAELTRLFQDGYSVADWRKKGFYPVISQAAEASADTLVGNVMFEMLKLT